VPSQIAVTLPSLLLAGAFVVFSLTTTLLSFEVWPRGLLKICTAAAGLAAARRGMPCGAACCLLQRSLLVR
jgi:hypothetical protein